MKKFAFGTALAMLVTPALAADPVVYIQDPVVHEQPSKVSGHVEWFLGGLRLDFDGESESAWIFGGDARVNYAIDRRWNIQGDLYGESIRFTDVGVSLDRFGGAAHAYWRDPDSFAIGAFGMYGTYPLAGGPSGLREYVFGPEAQAYFGNVTVYGQAYWGQVAGLGESFNQWGARGVLRYFVHDNFRLDGELAYNSLNFFGDNLNTLTALAQANYRFDDTPFTAFGRYQFDRLSAGGESVNAHRLVVGLRVTMGADTLMAEDRYGATMDLPRHIRLIFD